MALPPRSGSSTQSSSSNTPLSNAAPIPGEVIPGQAAEIRNTKLDPAMVGPLPPSRTDKLENMPVVSDPAMMRMAFDTSQYPQVTRGLLGYLRGKRVKVTYFHDLNSDVGDLRSDIVDVETERSLTHKSYMQIRNFEITLPGGYEYNWDSDEMTAEVNLRAYVYPGFNPTVGDTVLYPCGDNKIAYLKVSDVKPLALTNESVYEISMSFVSWPDRGTFMQLDLMSRDNVVYFNKVNYLGSVSSLLTEDRYQALEKMESMSGILSRHYFSSFFDMSMNSYIRPDNIYDPFIVKFLNAVMDFEAVGRRAQQLLPSVDIEWPRTIWARLLDRYNPEVKDLWPNYFYTQQVVTTFNAGITPLVNRSLIRVAPDDKNPLAATMPTSYEGYVFSPAFYEGNEETMTHWERFVYNVIRTRHLDDFATLLVSVNGYLDLEPIDQFYMIPLYLQLMRVARSSIARVVV